LTEVFLDAGGCPLNRPVTATVSPGVTELGLSDSDTSLTVTDGEIVVIGVLGAAPEFSRYACRATTNEELCRAGTRKHPVIRPLKDCWIKPLVVRHIELGSTYAAGVIVFLE
jgi:hypothetical protein